MSDENDEEIVTAADDVAEGYEPAGDDLEPTAVHPAVAVHERERAQADEPVQADGPAVSGEPARPAGILITPLMLWGGASLLAAVAGSLGPWVSLGPMGVSAIRGDGLISLVAAVIGIAALALPRFKIGVEIAVAGVIVALCAFDLTRVLSISGSNELFSVSPGWGIILLTVSGASLVAWCGAQLAQIRDRGILAAVMIGLAIALAVIGAESSSADSNDASSAKSALSDDTTSGDTSADDASSDDTSADDTSTDDATTTPAPTTGFVASAPLAMGMGVRLAGNDGLTMRATVTGVIDPLEGGDYDEPDSGDRYVGVELTLSNVGRTTYHDSPSNGATLLYGDDREADDGYISGGPCNGLQFSSLKIAPGGRRKGCLVYEVPTRNTVKTFQFTLDSGFADQTAEWDVRSALHAEVSAGSSSGSSGSSSSGGDDSASASGSKCDQNISAGPNTSCAFADATFKAYAKHVEGGGSGDVGLHVYSSAIEATLAVTCFTEDGAVECDTTSGASVSFPKWAADVY